MGVTVQLAQCTDLSYLVPTNQTFYTPYRLTGGCATDRPCVFYSQFFSRVTPGCQLFRIVAALIITD